MTVLAEDEAVSSRGLRVTVTPMQITPLRLVFSLAAFVSLVASISLAGCGSPAKLGEACDAEGQEGACEDGAVCGKGTDTLQCLKVCVEKSDCPANYDCNGISGSSIKGCRPDDSKK